LGAERFALCVARPRPDRRPSAEDINRIGRTRSRPAAHLRPCLLSCVIPDRTRRQHTRTRCTHGARAAPTRAAHKAVLKVIGARPWAHSTCGRHIYVSVGDHIRVRDRIPITPRHKPVVVSQMARRCVEERRSQNQTHPTPTLYEIHTQAQISSPAHESLSLREAWE
jgi:hypothetical protein